MLQQMHQRSKSTSAPKFICWTMSGRISDRLVIRVAWSSSEKIAADSSSYSYGSARNERWKASSLLCWYTSMLAMARNGTSG